MTTKTYTTELLPKVLPVPPKPDPEEDFIRQLYKHKLQFDDKPVSDILKSVSQKTKVRPELLLSSAIQEGLNYAVSRPDEVSEAYIQATEKGGLDTKTFPVDGFYNYGLDYFGDEYKNLKKYLPEGFENRFKVFKAVNEKKQPVNTAAFMSNEDALLAKSAFLQNAQDKVDAYLKRKGLSVPEEDKDYFTMAFYNGGPRNAHLIIDQYAKAKDKKKFLTEGETTQKEIHKNISPRLKRLKFLSQLMSEGLQNNQQITP